MKIIAFYIKQIILLGTTGFLAWLCVGWWHIGWFWANDAHYAWLIALALVALFLLLICTPIQVSISKVRNDSVAYLGGLLAGPTAILLYLALNTRFELNGQNYVTHQAWMHVIFGLLGLWFSFNYRRRFGPNNSFKPKPLRGSA
ncbi:hypothetical protein IB223_16175 [Pseudoxanthomonas sp. PXM03]|uniref:hypothetical protein n=1 Tax=Pseudoxanthomonas sp. PXM03 TaxID=2769284 RepID=UPI00177AB210|nr:hypothetical protein [Pseudoxanthomonas sp. PXM03]MBD9437634.1 hypothetical protein [Pseudoxanthomonas sp. PXM03]